MKMMARRLAALLALPLAMAQAPYRAIAQMRGAMGIDSQVYGTVLFEQLQPLGDVTVTVNMGGLRPGVHGFHVHQFGDVRSTNDLSTISAQPCGWMSARVFHRNVPDDSDGTRSRPN